MNPESSLEVVNESDELVQESISSTTFVNARGRGSVVAQRIGLGRFGRGRQVVEIDLPRDTSVVNAWVTEGGPHFGGAIFRTESVQLRHETHSARCRIVFSHNWGSALPAEVMLIRGT